MVWFIGGLEGRHDHRVYEPQPGRERKRGGRRLEPSHAVEGEPGPGETDPPAVLDLMHRVTLIPMVRRTLFGPRITIFTKDGRSYTKEGTGREFIWDYEQHARRIQPIETGLAISQPQFADLIDCCRHLDSTDHAASRLINLTIPAG